MPAALVGEQQNTVDSGPESGYLYRRESHFEEPIAAPRRTAAAQPGSWVLSRSHGFPEPHCQTAVGFLFLRNRDAAATTPKQPCSKFRPPNIARSRPCHCPIGSGRTASSTTRRSGAAWICATAIRHSPCP